MLVPVGDKRLPEQRIERFLFVLVGECNCLFAGIKRGALLKLKRICRDMVELELQDFVKCEIEVENVLVGQGEDEVAADVVKACKTCVLNTNASVIEAVNPPDRGKERVGGGLYADR